MIKVDSLPFAGRLKDLSIRSDTVGVPFSGAALQHAYYATKFELRVRSPGSVHPLPSPSQPIIQPPSLCLQALN